MFSARLTRTSAGLYWSAMTAAALWLGWVCFDGMPVLLAIPVFIGAMLLAAWTLAPVVAAAAFAAALVITGVRSLTGMLRSGA